MRLATRRSALGIFAFGITVASCGGNIPTDVRGQNRPTTMPLPAPVPRPAPILDFPEITKPAVIYRRITASAIPGEQRYVIFDDGTFSLQYLRPDWGFFEYLGRYARADTILALNFKDSDAAGPWEAQGVLLADSSLAVTYNLTMMFADFEEGNYRFFARVNIGGSP